MVKLEMVFYKTGYNRIPRVADVTGACKNWDNESRNFTSSSSEYVEKNQPLPDIRGVNTYPLPSSGNARSAISRYCSGPIVSSPKARRKRKKTKMLTVSQLLQARLDYFENHEKIKNGKLVKSVGTASMYKQLRNSLANFVQTKFRKELSRYYFTDITQTCLLEYVVFLEKRGIENGNKAGLRQLLRMFRALVNHAADELHMYGANPAIFESAAEKMARG